MSHNFIKKVKNFSKTFSFKSIFKASIFCYIFALFNVFENKFVFLLNEVKNLDESKNLEQASNNDALVTGVFILVGVIILFFFFKKGADAGIGGGGGFENISAPALDLIQNSNPEHLALAGGALFGISPDLIELLQSGVSADLLTEAGNAAINISSTTVKSIQEIHQMTTAILLDASTGLLSGLESDQESVEARVIEVISGLNNSVPESINGIIDKYLEASKAKSSVPLDLATVNDILKSVKSLNHAIDSYFYYDATAFKNFINLTVSDRINLLGSPEKVKMIFDTLTEYAISLSNENSRVDFKPVRDIILSNKSSCGQFFNYNYNELLNYTISKTFFHWERFFVLFYDNASHTFRPYFIHEIPNFTPNDLSTPLQYEGEDVRVYINDLEISQKIYKIPDRLR